MYGGFRCRKIFRGEGTALGWICWISWIRWTCIPSRKNNFTNLIRLYTIHLHHLEFFAFHGLYEEERVVGNNFFVSLDVDFESTQKIFAISETVDYTEIYEIVKSRMKISTNLIEVVAEEITAAIHQKFPQVKQIKISIQKSNPPIIGFKGNVGVSLQKKF